MLNFEASIPLFSSTLGCLQQPVRKQRKSVLDSGIEVLKLSIRTSCRYAFFRLWNSHGKSMGSADEGLGLAGKGCH